MVPDQPMVSCYTGPSLCLLSSFRSTSWDRQLGAVWASIHHDDNIIYYDLDYLDAIAGKRLTSVTLGRMRIMCGMYCIEPLERIYMSTWLGGQVASPREKEGYPEITINPKLTISGVA